MILNRKGYQIPLSSLTDEKLARIKYDLTIEPKTIVQILAKKKRFPIYSLDETNIYVPHYYGIQNFGIPKYEIPEGEDIDVPFNGKIREIQEEVVDKYITHVKSAPVQGGLLDLYCGFGKTVLSLNIISKLKKKTLIIVHKEFLLNQWVERINQFLPSARIGRIQGKVVDIENKDIVIGMLQSLSMKDYPEGTFDSFGMLLVDEAHHISSEVFSQTLQKIVTRYMLGLSATMNRKDGTTYVFKMYLGDIVHSIRREKTDTVEVRAINYNSTDEEFNHTILDFRQKPQYSSMISKLCEYQPRSDFIIEVLEDMVKEDPNQQIMILAHNKNLLTYLHDKVVEKDIGTVGYYVGGMKKEALEETTTKQIVIATYSMASEALDIKTLTTLIMATPKTDIEQSVGRILRECHAKPIIVDIIDSHDLFVNQYKKRKTFYRKCGYKIIGTSNTEYTQNIDEWKIIYQPKKKTSECDEDEIEEAPVPKVPTTKLEKASTGLLDDINSW